MIQNVAIDAGDEEVGLAVVIVVGGGGAHGIAGTGQTCFFGHVAKLHVTFVVIEAVPVLRAGFGERGKIGAVREEDIGTAVAIIVEDSETASHGFDHVLLRRGAIVQDERDVALRGDVLEADGSERHGRELEVDAGNKRKEREARQNFTGNSHVAEWDRGIRVDGGANRQLVPTALSASARALHPRNNQRQSRPASRRTFLQPAFRSASLSAIGMVEETVLPQCAMLTWNFSGGIFIRLRR